MILALLLAVPAAPAAPAALPLQQPFPLRNTTVREDGVRFVVEGRQTIPRGQKVVSLRQCRIVGAGPGAVLEVRGALELKAVTGGDVVLENVWIEAGPECKSLYLSSCRFEGGSGLRSSPEGAHAADVFLEQPTFERGAKVDVTMSGGKLIASNLSSRAPVVIRGVPVSERSANKLKLHLIGCTGRDRGLFGGLVVEGVRDATVSGSALLGGEVRFTDCAKLAFAANNVRSKQVVFEQTEAGRFGKTDISSCDFHGNVVRLLAPPRANKTEKLVLDHCYFRGMEDPETICAELVEDATRNPETGVVAGFKKVVTDPMGLGGKQ